MGGGHRTKHFPLSTIVVAGHHRPEATLKRRRDVKKEDPRVSSAGTEIGVLPPGPGVVAMRVHPGKLRSKKQHVH